MTLHSSSAPALDPPPPARADANTVVVWSCKGLAEHVLQYTRAGRSDDTHHHRSLDDDQVKKLVDAFVKNMELYGFTGIRTALTTKDCKFFQLVAFKRDSTPEDDAALCPRQTVPGVTKLGKPCDSLVPKPPVDKAAEAAAKAEAKRQASTSGGAVRSAMVPPSVLAAASRTPAVEASAAGSGRVGMTAVTARVPTASAFVSAAAAAAASAPITRTHSLAAPSTAHGCVATSTAFIGYAGVGAAAHSSAPLAPAVVASKPAAAAKAEPVKHAAAPAAAALWSAVPALIVPATTAAASAASVGVSAVSGFKRPRSSSLDSSDDDESDDERTSSATAGASGPASKRLCTDAFEYRNVAARLLPLGDDDDEDTEGAAVVSAVYVVPGTDGVTSGSGSASGFGVDGSYMGQTAVSGYDQWSVLLSMMATGVMPQPTGCDEADALTDLDF